MDDSLTTLAPKKPATTTSKKRKPPRLGELAPQYKFFLNPYTDVRFSTCPRCNGKTKLRKLPLAVHVNDWGAVLLNKACRFCPYCDLLIAHKDELEAHLVALFQQLAPNAVGSDFLVIGTVERKDWKRGLEKPLSAPEMLAALHDFKDVLRFEPRRWVYTGPQNPPATRR